MLNDNDFVVVHILNRLAYIKVNAIRFIRETNKNGDTDYQVKNFKSVIVTNPEGFMCTDESPEEIYDQIYGHRPTNFNNTEVDNSYYKNEKKGPRPTNFNNTG
jgi:hypothetical protein